MAVEAWLPIGYELPDNIQTQMALYEGIGWQIIKTMQDGRALIVTEELMDRWHKAKLLEGGLSFKFAGRTYWTLSSKNEQTLSPLAHCKSPQSKSEAIAFAASLKATRLLDATTPLQDALYIEKFSRLLPTYSITSQIDDDVVLGNWLTGGAHVSVHHFRRLQQILSWLNPVDLKEVIQTAGFTVNQTVFSTLETQSDTSRGLEKPEVNTTKPDSFELPGRPLLEEFFNEYIIDIVQNRNRYKSLGINFPSAVVLHGPPGCGKSFAIEALVEFLGWPSFQIDASSVASPYIHETSKKVADVFDQAIKNAPSVLIIDEMEAFLADRSMGSHHRVEEVAEFLRRIPEATKKDVLVVAMTNRIDMIDPAILRRGRFDHIIKIDFASETEVDALLKKLLSHLPTEADIDTVPLSKKLAQRPLSDVAFVVREGARLAARGGRDKLDQQSLMSALNAAQARS